MNIVLKGLPLGEWRDFTADERIELFELIETLLVRGYFHSRFNNAKFKRQ
ncbi:Ribosomal large subunit pseudouridine synthase F [Serratia fonticola]|uniref:Ribosomal large subunit pseudouridine synthase F n=1 Tax=Serratia fonticola TaxID=47917 RepID=A0A4U9WNB2_SERFO|nr:Ribosomal large subunit pseudouridine synthase F [Serratia fonticola]